MRMGASASARKVVPALLVHKIDYVALRSRLQLFGNSFSLEISPRDYHGSGIHCDGPLTKSWDRIGVGTVVYVNWVAKNIEHGSLVLEACKALTGKGLRPAPHLPACRFDSDEAFAQVLDGLKGTGGCNFAMMLGGNDCFERASAGEVPPRFSSASSLLLGGPDMPDTLEQLSSAGVTAVSVGGYPEGDIELSSKCANNSLPYQDHSHHHHYHLTCHHQRPPWLGISRHRIPLLAGRQVPCPSRERLRGSRGNTVLLRLCCSGVLAPQHSLGPRCRSRRGRSHRRRCCRCCFFSSYFFSCPRSSRAVSHWDPWSNTAQ